MVGINHHQIEAEPAFLLRKAANYNSELVPLSAELLWHAVN